MSAALILTGAPGSGKSSVLDALSTLLEVDGVEFGAIETEQFSRGLPWLSLSQWLPQLSAVIALQKEARRDTFLVVATTENEQELRAVIGAVAADRVLVICVSAPPRLVAERVAKREPDTWPGKQALIEHARHLAVEIPAIRGIDAVIPTDGRLAGEVAAQIREQLILRGVLRSSVNHRHCRQSDRLAHCDARPPK